MLCIHGGAKRLSLSFGVLIKQHIERRHGGLRFKDKQTENGEKNYSPLGFVQLGIGLTLNLYVSRRNFSELIIDWIEKKSSEKLQLSSTTISSLRRKCSMSPNHKESDFGDGFEASIMADSWIEQGGSIWWGSKSSVKRRTRSGMV
ncbi:hypothetical protein MRB53_021310 [Persea americana]|uniref:Uncharacterized protein n=1 Tax=Persea americana TaxID=3435 RepID=A0ACC2L4N8_PERAE|nr:hypothetical protein MRB53_021310 [Persea americana]